MSYYAGVICSECGNEVCQSCGSCHDEHTDVEETEQAIEIRTIQQLRKQVSIKTAPNHGLLDLYRRSK